MYVVQILIYNRFGQTASVLWYLDRYSNSEDMIREIGAVQRFPFEQSQRNIVTALRLARQSGSGVFLVRTTPLGTAPSCNALALFQIGNCASALYRCVRLEGSGNSVCSLASCQVGSILESSS